jgi:predicted transcriptional regulator
MKLHPTAEALATAERAYQRDVAKAARSKSTRDKARGARDAAILADTSDRPVTEIAAEYGLTEGGVRRIRRDAAGKEKS